MWFKVEVYEDGSVKSCEPVEACKKDGVHCFYVEAASKVEALEKASAKYDRRLESYRQHRENRKQQGLCARCGKRSPINGLLVCESCRQKKKAINAACYERKKRGAPALKSKRAGSPDEKEALIERTMRADKIRNKTTRSGEAIRSKLRVKVLREVLENYQKMSNDYFRRYLESEIAECEAFIREQKAKLAALRQSEIPQAAE